MIFNILLFAIIKEENLELFPLSCRRNVNMKSEMIMKMGVDVMYMKKEKPDPLFERLAVSHVEAAQMIGSNRHTIDRLINCGKLRAVRIGRRIHIPVARIVEFTATAEEIGE